MRLTTKLHTVCGLLVALVSAVPFVDRAPGDGVGDAARTISRELFYELEELARIVDISYCVGSTGISKPFTCASRCSDFEGFELIKSWNTGVLMSDSCGYIALSHPPWPKRILVAFRGTYSIANTIADLSTVPQEYIPYPTDGGEGDDDEVQPNADVKCNNCTVHAGFLRSWLNTRDQVVPEIRSALAQYPDYEVVLVGHSLGGAVAALAALELQGHGLHPHVTTFGEPRVGNRELMKYIDARFDLGATPDDAQDAQQSLYRRVTHVNDPVPLLPLEEWGYYMHAGEVYISKLDLSPDVEDLRRCFGDEDPTCISDSEEDTTPSKLSEQEKHEVQEILAKQRRWLDLDNDVNEEDVRKSHSIFTSGVPPRYRLWELFFAHRDYFWRLGLCIPGGDPKDWWRVYPPKDGQNEKDIGQDEL